ncbi:hypothetical protein [Silvibacterium sp.]|uniref:hypothetical protein n=1 Tax=Silvibacterium sp. TaxID=1964179 RepID=UPI0039E35032
MPRCFPSLTCFLATGLFLTLPIAPVLRAQNTANPDALVAAHDWPGLEEALASSDGKASGAGFYRGLLLEHAGQFEASRSALTPLLPELAKGQDRDREALARLALAEDAARLFDYKEAGAEFAGAQQCCSAAMTSAERTQAETGAAAYTLLAASPAMTLDKAAGFNVPLDRSASGLRELMVYVDGRPSRWLFAPAAPFAMLSRAQGKVIGLKPLGAVTAAGIDGKLVQAEIALIPQLRFGGVLLRNVPVLLCDEAALPEGVEGLLPLPVLAMLGTVTATDDDHLNVRPEGLPAESAALFTDDGRLLAATTDGLLFAIDPLKLDSALSPRLRPAAGAKVGNLALGFGAAQAAFQRLAIGDGDEPAPFAGTLGDDALDQLAGYSFDFRSMRFAVQTHPQ